MKWVILGAGNISNKFCENLLDIKDTEILAIASQNRKKLNEFGDKFKIKKDKRFNNYNDILKIEFDVAYVGLINSLHNRIINDLALNKKNILTEKPCFLNISDFDKNIDLIKKNNVLFVESMMNMHHPQTSKIFELINNGKIGSIINFNHKFGFDIRKKFLKFFKKKINFLNRFTDPQLGGGAINDLGCYGVSFSNKLAALNGSDTIIDSKISNKYTQTGVDENSKIIINYKSNFESNIHVAINENLGCETEIVGTKGKIIVKNLVQPETSYKFFLINGETTEYNFRGNKLYTYIAKDVNRYIKNGIKQADGFGLNFGEIRRNIEVLDLWKNKGNKF